jgi:hypothetical protein
MDSKWPAFKARIKGAAKSVLSNNKSDGAAVISVHLLVTPDGEPLLWVVQKTRRIEPSRDAKDILLLLAEEM